MARPSTVKTLPVQSSRELSGRGGETTYGPSRWDRSNLYAATRRALWRSQLTNLLLAALAALLAAGVVYHAGRTRIIPYVVEVDRHGQALAFGPAEELADPDRRMVMHALSLWIVRTRTVSADREIQRRELLAAYEYTGGRAVDRLNAWYREHPPFARAERETVAVELESLLALDEGARRWRLQWTERVQNGGGAPLRSELWQALVTVSVTPPEAVEQVLANPLGIRVIDFDWQRLSGMERP